MRKASWVRSKRLVRLLDLHPRGEHNGHVSAMKQHMLTKARWRKIHTMINVISGVHSNTSLQYVLDTVLHFLTSLTRPACGSRNKRTHCRVQRGAKLAASAKMARNGTRPAQIIPKRLDFHGPCSEALHIPSWWPCAPPCAPCAPESCADSWAQACPACAAWPPSWPSWAQAWPWPWPWPWPWLWPWPPRSIPASVLRPGCRQHQRSHQIQRTKGNLNRRPFLQCVYVL